MNSRWVIAMLSIACFASLVAVVVIKHQSRIRFYELQTLNRERDELDIDWGRLQIEQSTWAAHGRVQVLAKEKLGMVNPDNRSWVFLVKGEQGVTRDR
jgi:cell division protein FtsL